MQNRAENSESKSSKRGLYPYVSMERCLEAAAGVSDLGGSRSEVQKSVLAHELKVDEGSAAFKQLIGSVKCFDLVSGRGSYTLTETAKEYFFPTDEQQQRRAKLKILKAPLIYERLITRFDGSRLPSGDMLSNVLRREYHVTDSWAPRVASLFTSALREADVIDPSGYLRYESSYHRTSAGIDGQAAPEQGEMSGKQAMPPVSLNDPVGLRPSLVPPPSNASINSTVDAGSNVWVFRHSSGYVRLETSSDLSFELWEKLNQYVGVIKPISERAKE